MNGFETLGQFTRDDERALPTQRGGERLERDRNPVRSLIEYERERVVAQARQHSPARCRSRWQEAVEQPLRRGDPRRRQRRDDRARAGDRHDGVSGLSHCVHQRYAWIAHRRRSRVAHQRDALARAEKRYDLDGPPALVVRVQRQHSRRDAVARKQLGGHARVLGRDDVDRSQDIERAQGDVAQVSERRRDHI